jgi:transcriptional regulator with GAF, ATPase, and Fis domain
MDQPRPTTRVVDDLKHPKLLRRKLKIEVLEGPDAGKRATFGAEEVNVGSLPANDLALTDTSVSRYHLRVAGGANGFVLTDLDSTNGTYFGPLRIREVTVQHAVDLRLGDTVIRLAPLEDEVEVPLHATERYGTMLGRSPQMRALFAQIGPVATAESTVLIEGETGTGKEILAEEIHRASRRKGEAFIVLDCGAIPEHLIESELFGHVRGAFTGATADRTGAFELAHGGTLFLDEIGEMSIVAQPKLLRALETRQVKPVGAGRYKPANVRIIAATNRDVRLAVNEGTFRADLYYRLSVVRLRLPPLRERPEDVELLADMFMGESWQRLLPGVPVPPLSRETVQRLLAHRWPGNIRELRNFMERVALMARSGSSQAPDLDLTPAPASAAAPAVPVDVPYKDAKMRWIDQFEVAYVAELLRQNNGNVAGAARQAGVDRTYFFRLIRRYGIER